MIAPPSTLPSLLEPIANAIEHGQARTVRVAMERLEGELAFHVSEVRPARAAGARAAAPTSHQIYCAREGGGGALKGAPAACRSTGAG
jgi:hypothetical protein